MTDKPYPYEKKKRLANKISKIKNQDVMIKLFEIISEDNNQFSENNNGIFMLFHKLNDNTYYKIESYLKKLSRNKILSSTTSEEHSSTKPFAPYIEDEFPEEHNLSPKYKYSNKEKNIIKRQRYDKAISTENNVDSDIIYQTYGDTSSDIPIETKTPNTKINTKTNTRKTRSITKDI